MWPGFDFGVNAICVLNLLVLYSARRGFPYILQFRPDTPVSPPGTPPSPSPGTPGFSSTKNPNLILLCRDLVRFVVS